MYGLKDAAKHCSVNAPKENLRSIYFCFPFIKLFLAVNQTVSQLFHCTVTPQTEHMQSDAAISVDCCATVTVLTELPGRIVI